MSVRWGCLAGGIPILVTRVKYMPEVGCLFGEVVDDLFLFGCDVVQQFAPFPGCDLLCGAAAGVNPVSSQQRVHGGPCNTMLLTDIGDAATSPVCVDNCCGQFVTVLSWPARFPWILQCSASFHVRLLS